MPDVKANASTPPGGAVPRTGRNHSMDVVKGLACIAIVFMHCEFPGRFGTLIQCLVRFGVPFFFMVSGFFCFRPQGTVNYGKKIRHIAVITFWTVLFYALLGLLSGRPFSSKATGKAILDWVVFNEPFYIAGPMWFLFALLYDYALFALVDRKGTRWIPVLAVPVGIVLYIAMAQGAHCWEIHIPNRWYRNFLVEGFSLFSLGWLLASRRGRLRIPNGVLWGVLLVSTALCPVERFLLGRDFGVNIVTFPQVTALFLLCVNNPEMGKGSVLETIGLKYSMFVYILHPAVWHLLDRVYAVAGIAGNPVVGYLRPLLCVSVAILASMAFVGVKTVCLNRMKGTP